MNTDKATPRPWYLGKQDKPMGYIPIYARLGATQLARIATTDAHEVGFGISEDEHKANAAIIVRAVNSHDALVAALKSLYYAVSEDEADYPDTQLYNIVMDAKRKASIALAQAKGE